MKNLQKTLLYSQITNVNSTLFGTLEMLDRSFKLKIMLNNTAALFLFIYLFFYLAFLSQTFTNHRTAAEGGGHFFNSSLPLPPASQTRRH